MILVEGTLWPLVVVGAVSDVSAPEGLTLVDEGRLEASEGLLVALVVAGVGDRALQAQREVLQWLHRVQPAIRRGALRLAWVVEDTAARACTDAWLRLVGDAVFAERCATFQSLPGALSWLLDLPPQSSERRESGRPRDERDGPARASRSA